MSNSGFTFRRVREEMIETLLDLGIKDFRVLDAISQVPRHIFLDEALRSRAYENRSLTIGYKQTISQPYIVARMTELLISHTNSRGKIFENLLELGSGCGYQSAVLSFFPRIILGGLLFNLGLSFLVDWLYSTWSRVPKTDYTIILLIFLVIGTVGFLEGVITGLLMSVILFVVSYSKVEIIKHELTGKTFHSNVERSESIKNIIDDILFINYDALTYSSVAQLVERVTVNHQVGGSSPSRGERILI